MERMLGAISKREPRGRVRIGYFSADLYYHPVSIWLAEQLENHDKSKVELYAFCLKSVQDPMRDRLEAAFDHWIDVQSMSDLEVAKLSRELEIDIAIDLNGHTADGRTGIFAARAAPIQLNHLGFPGSMGADYIDYVIGHTPSPDEDLEELARNRQFMTEKIAYVPSSFTYDRQRQLSDEPLTRAQFGLPETGFVFTCQNGCQKLMPEVFDVWMEILKAVPGSVLWLLKPNETAVKNLIKEANARGVEAERLIFTAREVVPIDQEKARIAKYLASYKLADLFLDTWPYNAGTTAIDALWAGLPVLTKEGKAGVARMAAGALRAIEVPELITRTLQAYQELAIQLAHSPQKLKLLKEKVQANRLTTALFDPVGNTRHIENAYLEMYRRYQQGLKPEDFVIHS
jgi:predicted O-linked N-acetylglucosamine transferase (SPINDLY family)